MPRKGQIIPLPDRFWPKVAKSDGCWTWTAFVNPNGYGTITSSPGEKPRSKLAHRVAYELMVGPIPDGLTLDHLCRNRACVNPAHLEPVSMAENNRRGESYAAQNARKTHCKRGHPLTDDNVYRLTSGSRSCKICVAEVHRPRRDARRNELRAQGIRPT